MAHIAPWASAAVAIQVLVYHLLIKPIFWVGRSLDTIRSRFKEAVYVLHAFVKTTRAMPGRDVREVRRALLAVTAYRRAHLREID